MDEDLLKLFIEITQLGSFQKVAEKNFISQRAVSKRIKLLEETLQVTLFSRESNKITLTPAGDHFLHRAKQMLTMIHTTNYELRQLNASANQRLSVGYFSPFDGAVIKKALFQLPTDIAVTIKESGVEHLVSDVLMGELDCAVILDNYGYHYDYQQLQLAHFPVHAGTMLMGVSNRNPYAGAKKISERLLQEKPVVYYSNEESTYLKRAFESSLGTISSELNVVRQASFEQMQMLVGLNQVTAFYPGGVVETVQNPAEAITYLPLETNADQHFTFELIYKNQAIKPSLQTFIDLFSTQR